MKDKFSIFVSIFCAHLTSLTRIHGGSSLELDFDSVDFRKRKRQREKERDDSLILLRTLLGDKAHARACLPFTRACSYFFPSKFY